MGILDFWEEQFDQQTYGLAPGTINQLKLNAIQF